MAEFNTEFWLNIIITEIKLCPVPGSLQQCSSTCTTQTVRQGKVSRTLPFILLVVKEQL